MSNKFLLIDAATPKVFAAIFDCECGVISLEYGSGHVVDSLFAVIDSILTKNNCKLSDFSGIIFCGGPGSTLGVRTSLMFIRTITALINKDFTVYRYSTFDLAFAENPEAENIVLSYANGKVLVKSRLTGVVKIVEKNEAESLNNDVFLQTKRIQDDITLPVAKYDFIKFNENILDLSQKVQQADQINVDDGDSTFVKWNCVVKF